MASALKSFILGMSVHLGTKPAALYERQRALVRAGLLKVDGSKGPGGGVRATPETVALLLISVMATDSLSSVASISHDIIRLKASQEGNGLCISDNFWECFAEILAVEFMRDRVERISICRTEKSAWIDWIENGKSIRSVFPGAISMPEIIRVDASVSRDLLKKISEDLAFVAEDDDSSSAD